MSDVLTQPKKKVRVFGCGGAGTNIAYRLEDLRSAKQTGFAELDIVYADTSRSNLRPDIPAKSVYLVDGVDGSGKVRSENHVEIHGRVKDILQQFKPADVNLMIHSAAGGTGSVIAPLLVRELLQRDAPVLVLMVGDAGTRKDVENTLKTIKSYEAIVRATNTPVVMAYMQNSSSLTRAMIDDKVRELTGLLCALYSGENRELDSQDLFNFLHFSNEDVTTYKPQLAALTLCGPNDDVSDLGNIITVATLAMDGQNHVFPRMAEVQFTGYLAENFPKNIADHAPHHFVVSDGPIHDHVSALNTTLQAMDELVAARISRKGILNSDDRATDSGLIL